jgi:selenide, water dikinase
MPVNDDDRVLVDYRTADDAGVYRIDANRALVQTVDFFTPIVDDPFVYGQIAAANAVSDVYAMGGRPLTALAIAGLPRALEHAVITRIFAGGLSKLNEAGVALLGGHTVQDAEVKFGYAVTGEVDPQQMLTNAGARPGDVLILTKAIGTGVIATAAKFERALAGSLDGAVESMIALNKSAAEVLRQLPADAVHACTDITGFGLIGHGSEMAAASGCSLEIQAAAVPVLGGALELVKTNLPGGGKTNREHFVHRVRFETSIGFDMADLLVDPQTSGGLLVSIAAAHAAKALQLLAAVAPRSAIVGRVLPSHEHLIVVR